MNPQEQSPLKPPAVNRDKLLSIIAAQPDERWGLIPLLQKIQEEFGYIPPEAIEPVAESLDLFPSEVQGVITFYSGFSLKPKGKYVLKVCRGTACHVKGSRGILRLMKKELKLEEGETSSDYQFTLETVACLGACFVAPAMMINRNYFGKLAPGKVTSIIAEHQKDRKAKKQ